MCQAGLQKHADAAATFQTLLKDDPKYAGADKVLYELAWALKQQGKEKESAEVFARLAAERPDSPLAAEAQYHVGEFAYQSGDLKAAAAACHAAWQRAGQTELGREGRLPRRRIAVEAEEVRRGPGGLRTSEESGGQGFRGARAAARRASGRPVGQWEKCLELLTKCIEQFPDSPCLPEALCERGWVEQNLGKLDEAAALYERVLSKTDARGGRPGTVPDRRDPVPAEDSSPRRSRVSSIVIYGYSYPQWQAEAAYEAGRCFEAMGKKEQAVKQYQELIEKYPQSEKAPLAKQRIEEYAETKMRTVQTRDGKHYRRVFSASLRLGG